ncbi:unnamed protein product [Calypogeia fissa]
MQFFSILREIITLTQRPEHDQFWKDMGLYAFVHLQWNTTIGTMAECAEFVKHSTPVATLVGEEVIHLLEEDVAGFFHLGMAETKDIAARARSWQSQKFTAPKEKNGYKLNTCTDKNLVERLEFIRAALYLQERRNVITGVQVREAEEVRGGSNWAKHLFKQLHHDLDVARSTKKCRALNHIRIIFLALARDKKQKEAATEDAPPGFPAPQGTKGLQSVRMTTPTGGAKSAMRGAAGAKAKPPPKQIILRTKPPQKGNPKQVLGIKVKPPQKDKSEVVAPGPGGQPQPPSPTNAEIEVALEPLPLFNRGEAPPARKKRRASRMKRSSSQETTSEGVNSNPDRSRKLEDYLEYIREVIVANEGGCEETPFEKMCQVTTKSFCQGLIDSLYPQVYNHSVELLRWSRFMAKEIGRLHNKEDNHDLKCKGLQDTIDRLTKELEGNKQSLLTEKDIEIQVLIHTNNSFKANLDSNEKELMELGEERDEAVLDAANATSKMEALTEKIKELEGKLLTLRAAGSTPNKRPRDS